MRSKLIVAAAIAGVVAVQGCSSSGDGRPRQPAAQHIAHRILSGGQNQGDIRLDASPLPHEPLGWGQLTGCIQTSQAKLWIDGTLTNHGTNAATFYLDFATGDGPQSRVVLNLPPGATAPIETTRKPPSGKVVSCTLQAITNAN